MKLERPTSLEAELNEHLMSDAEIEERIAVLFQNLPLNRQSAVLDELRELLEDDDGEEEPSFQFE